MSPRIERKRPGGESHLVRRPEPISTGTTAAAQPAVVTVASADVLPEPYAATATGKLSQDERAYLTTCEAALDNLRVAFAVAGKALQVIRDGRLYRGEYGTFEEYVETRWDMSRAQAYRLIDAWPLAVRLSPMGDTTLNERQVRELLPVADQHGQDAAEVVYRTVAETDGVQVTAALLHGAVSVLPERWDPAEAVRQIRAYLAGTLGPPGAPVLSPIEMFTGQAGRFVRALHQAVDRGTLKAAASEDPDAVRQVIADLRAVLDEIEQKAL
jgi:hypothetical protein